MDPKLLASGSDDSKGAFGVARLGVNSLFCAPKLLLIRRAFGFEHKQVNGLKTVCDSGCSEAVVHEHGSFCRLP